MERRHQPHWPSPLSTAELRTIGHPPPRTEKAFHSKWTAAFWLIAAAGALAVAALYASGRAGALGIPTHHAPRLALAALIGLVVTAVHRRERRDHRFDYSFERAQTLLCVAGALTMILIDNSIARAFGIAGAASVVRFRTPLDDPTDATVMFLLVGLGMACGVGATGVAVAGTVAVCLLLVGFGTFRREPRTRAVTIELVAAGREFPDEHVSRVFARHGIEVQPCEWSQDERTRAKYRAWVDPALRLDVLGADLMNDGASGLASVTWELRKSAA